jgi:hypothetical protein
LGLISTFYSGYNNQAYSNAFAQASNTTLVNGTVVTSVTYTTVNSQFKDMYLGPTTDSKKITGILYANLSYYFSLINNALDPMLNSWTYLNTTEGQATISATLTNGASSLMNFSKVI